METVRLYHFTDKVGLSAILEAGSIAPNLTPTWPLTGRSVVYMTTDPEPGWCCYTSGTGFHGSVRFTVEVPSHEVIHPWDQPRAWEHPHWSDDEHRAVARSHVTHRVLERPIVEDEWVTAQDMHTGEEWWHDITGLARTEHVDPHEPDSPVRSKLRYLAELSAGHTARNPSPWNTPRR